MNKDFATSYAAIIKSERQEDGTLMVYGKATDDAIDSDNQICDAGWLNKAMPDWFRTGGNIREQHSNIAAGVAKELDSKADGHYITAHVVDSSSVKKVEAGVLKGFSIGIRAPRVVRDEKAVNGRIIDGQIVEVSLVDRPANPNAKLMLAKSDGTDVIQVEEMIEQELPTAEVVETETAEKRAYGESAEGETDEGNANPDTAQHEVDEATGKEPIEKESHGCDCAGCMKCAADGGCDSKMCKGCTKMKSDTATISKCLECGCGMVGQDHGLAQIADPSSTGQVVVAANVSTADSLDTSGSIKSDEAEEVPAVETPAEEVKAEEEVSAEESAEKTLLSDEQLNAIIEKAVSVATESVKVEFGLVKSALEAEKNKASQLETELVTAKSLAVGNTPKRSTIVAGKTQTNDLLAKAAEFNHKASITTDSELAKGYKELANDFLSKAQAN